MKSREPAVAALCSSSKVAKHSFKQECLERSTKAAKKLARVAMENLRLEQAKVCIRYASDTGPTLTVIGGLRHQPFP